MTAATHQAMESWSPAHATSLKEARRRTALVHIIRVLFLSGSVIAAGLLLGSIFGNAFTGGPGALQATPPNVTILNPRFEGRDASDRPYIITADTARRRPNDVGVVDLTNPKFADELNNTADAREGVYDREGQMLDLTGGVVMRDPGGYTFTTENATMFVQDNRIVGETEIRGEGPIGELRADAYEVRDNGKRVIFHGNVWSRFVAKTKQAPEGEANIVVEATE